MPCSLVPRRRSDARGLTCGGDHTPWRRGPPHGGTCHKVVPALYGLASAERSGHPPRHVPVHLAYIGFSFLSRFPIMFWQDERATQRHGSSRVSPLARMPSASHHGRAMGDAGSTASGRDMQRDEADGQTKAHGRRMHRRPHPMPFRPHGQSVKQTF